MKRFISNLTSPVFYTLSFTWGFIFTLTGILTAIPLLLSGHKPKRWGWCWYFEVGKKDWGGADRGIVFLKSKVPASERLMNHEFGHALQNCVFGPFMLVLVSLPSTIRYWIRRISEKHGRMPKTGYDDIWFEGQATRLGSLKMQQLRSSADSSSSSSAGSSSL